MTAEVGVMNKIGIALAADSAVTIGRNAEKIYTSAEKLFQLCENASIEVMIYGNANFVGVPWETIIKSYRAKIGDLTLNTVQEHANHFLKFLSNSPDLFPLKNQHSHLEFLTFSLYHTLLNQIKKKLSHEAERRNGLTERDIPPILNAVVKSALNSVQQQRALKNISPTVKNGFKRTFQRKIGELIKQVFEDLPFTKSAITKLKQIAFENLFRETFGEMKSGLVVAGFGSKEYTPSLVHYVLEEMINSKVRLIQARSSKITDDNSAAVVPFAQHDMVRSFMEGIHQDLSDHIVDTTSEVFLKAFSSIIDEIKKQDARLGKTLAKKVTPALQSMLEKLFDDWGRHRGKYWKPVIDVVDSLPKDELAAMAEALVNLTKFRRRITKVPETSGWDQLMSL